VSLETVRVRSGDVPGAGIVAAGRSDVGRVRDVNEDAFLIARSDPALARRGAWQLVAVADGMGGHAAGEIASELALDAFENELDDLADRVEELGEGWRSRLESRLRAAVSAADRAVRVDAGENPERTDMGTTLVAALLVRGRLGVAHVGDSRAFLARDGRVEQLTVDHSWAEDQRRLGALNETDIARSPMRESVTRALGTGAPSEPDIAWWRLRPGDLVVLASDGLTRYADEEALASVLSTVRDPGAVADELVRRANDAGGRDNVTVVVARFDGLVGAPLPDDPPAPQED